MGIVKAILAGESGNGKTGALISLIEADYNLRILDLDDGLDFLRSLILERCPERIQQVNYHTIKQEMRILGSKLTVKGMPTVFNNAMKALNNWDEEAGISHLYTWGPKDILVIDSLTFLAQAAFLLSKGLNGRLGTPVTDRRDYGNAGITLEDFFNFICAEQVKCNIIGITHISHHEMEDPNGKMQLVGTYPALIGKKIETKLGTYFNSILCVHRKGTGTNEKRIILTKNHKLLKLKGASTTVPAELPIETGLADFFKLVRIPADIK